MIFAFGAPRIARAPLATGPPPGRDFLQIKPLIRRLLDLPYARPDSILNVLPVVRIGVHVSPLVEGILELLACPVPECRGALTHVDDRLVCGRCGRRYPMHESWPVLIPEEAELPSQTKTDGP